MVMNIDIAKNVDIAKKSKLDKQWKIDVKDGVRNVNDLKKLPLTPEELLGAEQVSKHHKVRVPKKYLELIDWNDPEDPIRKQVIPTIEELAFEENELEDPIGDEAHSPVQRLTHRYPDRVLLYPTYVCSVYCRYCFRKESLNESDRGYDKDALEPAFEYIQDNPKIREVILTGGDPLFIPEKAIEYIKNRLESIEHIRLLRIHTRVPVALPTKINKDLVNALKGRLMIAIVTHFNHPREITQEAIDGCRLLREAGFMLLNQSVLLKGVNDDKDTLKELFQELVYSLGAKPYYLHHCDLVRGMTHLRTSIDKGYELMQSLRGYISGLCNPNYVLDLPGGSGKIPLGPTYVNNRAEHVWEFKTYDNKVQHYKEVIEK